MGSAKCEIEWNGNFEVKYLTDYIKLKHEILNTNEKDITELACKKNSTHTNKMPFSSSCKHGTLTRTYRRKNACLIKRRGLSFIWFLSYAHSVKTLLKFKCLYKNTFFIFLNEQKLICKLKSWTWADASNAFIGVIPWIEHRVHMLNKFKI